MGSRRRREPTNTLVQAARSIARANQQLLDSTPRDGGLSHEQLRETGWQLVQVTGELAETVATLALRLDEHSRSRLLRTHDGDDPRADLARAARQLTALRQALEHADAAGRDYHACLSRLVVDADPTLPEPSMPTRSRSARGRRGKG